MTETLQQKIDRLRNALMDCRDTALMTATTGHQTAMGALQDIYHTANDALEATED